MQIYVPGQRWISETEPELGLGLVAEATNRTVQVFYQAANEMRHYAINNAPLKRVRFEPGDQVESREGVQLAVETVSEENGLFRYAATDGTTFIEADLCDTSSFDRPETRLLGGHVDANALFDLRVAALNARHRYGQLDVRGLLGGRVDLLPHQLYIAQEVSSRPLPRVLLADEVGLGKTIEACLILHRLMVCGMVGRVLILVPHALVHLTVNIVLDRIETGHMDEHGRVLVFLSAQSPHRAGEQERVDRLVEGKRQFVLALVKREVSVLVLLGHPAATAVLCRVVIDGANEVEFSITPILASVTEYLSGTNIVGRGGKIDDEGGREQVWAFGACLTSLMDEDVRERCCCVTNIGGPGKRVKNTSHQSIDGRRLMFLVRFAVGVENLLASVDACVVCFVIDHQEGKFGYDPPPTFRVMDIGNMVSDPPEKPLQNGFVLLDDEQPWSLFRRNTEVSRDARSKVAVVRAVGGKIRADAWVAVDFTNPDDLNVVWNRFCLVTKEARVEAHLSLRS